MEFDPFFGQVLATGSYATPEDHRPRLAGRLLGWCDAWYHLRVIGIVISGCRYARRGDFDRGTFANHGLATLRLAEDCGGRAVISGMDLPWRVPGPKVFVANHMSALDTMLFPALLLAKSDVTIVIKASLLDYPFFGTVLRAVDPIPVLRASPRDDLKQVLTAGTDALKGNRSVMLFPQSTRTVTFDRRQFNTMGAKLAARAGVPLVPIALKTDFHGIGRLRRDAGPVRRDKPIMVGIGAPIQVEGKGREAHQECVDFIATHLKEWGADVSENGEEP